MREKKKAMKGDNNVFHLFFILPFNIKLLLSSLLLITQIYLSLSLLLLILLKLLLLLLILYL